MLLSKIEHQLLRIIYKTLLSKEIEREREMANFNIICKIGL